MRCLKSWLNARLLRCISLPGGVCFHILSSLQTAFAEKAESTGSMRLGDARASRVHASWCHPSHLQLRVSVGPKPYKNWAPLTASWTSATSRCGSPQRGAALPPPFAPRVRGCREGTTNDHSQKAEKVYIPCCWSVSSTNKGLQAASSSFFLTAKKSPRSRPYSIHHHGWTRKR